MDHAVIARHTIESVQMSTSSWKGVLLHAFNATGGQFPVKSITSLYFVMRFYQP